MNLASFSGIYLIEFPDGRNYVGITTKAMRHRFIQHRAHATWGKNTLVAKGLREFGDAVKFKVLVTCGSKRLMQNLETQFIEGFNTLAPAGRNTSPGGTIVSEASAARISRALTGRVFSPEWRAKLGKNRRTVKVGGAVFPSIQVAAESHGLSRPAASSRLRSSNYPEWVCEAVAKTHTRLPHRPVGVVESKPRRRKSF